MSTNKDNCNFFISIEIAAGLRYNDIEFYRRRNLYEQTIYNSTGRAPQGCDVTIPARVTKSARIEF